jgi:hypothetical protein
MTPRPMTEYALYDYMRFSGNPEIHGAAMASLMI